jgi:hypothetical protein
LLDSPLGTPMMGYGARQSPSHGLRDPLHARALYLSSGAGELLWLEAELCLLGVNQATAVREQIALRTGLPVDCVLVGCTHTHSGPDTGLASVLADHPAPEWVPALLAALVAAGVNAHARAAPARLGVGSTDLAVGRNRRLRDAAVDRTATVVRVDRADGSPLAVLYLHGCHPTALGHDNLDYSADWPGAAGRAIESALPGCTAIFAPAAHADIDPRTRGLLDLAIPDQSVGVSFEEADELGHEAGLAIAEAAENISTHSDARVSARLRAVPVPVHGGDLSETDYRAHQGALRVDALAALDLPPDAPLRTAGFYQQERERTAGLATSDRREAIARVRLYLRDRTAPHIARGRVPKVTVQLLRLGPLEALALPIEVCTDVGLEWRARNSCEHASIVSIANGWLRYLPHPANFEIENAHHGYEVLQSTLVPDAATRLLDAAEELADS